MKTLFLLASVLGLATAGAFGQTYGNITVTGTASVNELDTSGIFDLRGDSAYFGSWQGNPNQPGATFSYSEGTGGTNAAFTSTLTRPGAAWNWLLLDASGNPSAIMELDPSNRLILGGTPSSISNSVVIDPSAGQISVNGCQVLTNGNGLTMDSSGNATIEGNLTAPSLSFPSGPLEIQPYGNQTFFNNNTDNGTGSLVQISSGGNPLGIAGPYSFISVNDTGWSNCGFVTELFGTSEFFCGSGGDGAEGIGRDDFTVFDLQTGIPNFTVDQNDNVYIGAISRNLAQTSLIIAEPQSNIVSISGTTQFSTTVEVPQQGDLSMGSFTASPDGFASGAQSAALAASYRTLNSIGLSGTGSARAILTGTAPGNER